MKVSIWMITYNHEEYIAQAIESVLMQQTNFTVELVIGEDCSTDRTREVCEKFYKDYPDKIRLLLPSSNLGMMPNFIQTYKACKGKYIAMLEGDDYWTDPLKLQKQVDFLEANPDFTICFHNMYIREENEVSHMASSNQNQQEVTTIHDLCRMNYIYTASCVFKNKLFDDFPLWFFQSPIGDWPLHLLNAQFGKIKYINEIMGVYRVHAGGIWSLKNKIDSFTTWLPLVTLLDKHFNYRYKTSFNYQRTHCYYELLNLYKKEGKLFYFLKYLFLCSVNKNSYEKYSYRDLLWHIRTFTQITSTKI